MIAEFYQYKVGEEELEEILRIAEKKPSLHYKIKDVSLIYQEFKQYSGR
jgi:ATP-dependent helicase/DNAse subunit B